MSTIFINFVISILSSFDQHTQHPSGQIQQTTTTSFIKSPNDDDLDIDFSQQKKLLNPMKSYFTFTAIP